MSKILVVDDAKLIREKLTKLLTTHNYDVVGKATNGEEAVSMYQSLRPDLVTLDITMPVMDGMQALQRIMESDPRANVIMCSAMGQHRLVVEAIELGAKDFIIKPFEDARVLETIESVLALHCNI